MAFNPKRDRGFFNDIQVENFDNARDPLKVTNAAGTQLFTVDNAGAIDTASTLTVDGASTLTGAVTVTGVTTTTGGISPTSSVLGARTFWGGGIPVTLATMGNDTAADDGSRWVTSVFIPHNVTLTGIAYLIGSVGGTDDVIVELKSSTGASLANSILDDSIIVGTAANIQSVPFTSTFAAIGPASFFLVVTFNGTTAKLRTHTIPALPFATDKISGTFATLAAITAPTTYTADQGPVIATY